MKRSEAEPVGGSLALRFLYAARFERTSPQGEVCFGRRREWAGRLAALHQHLLVRPAEIKGRRPWHSAQRGAVGFRSGRCLRKPASPLTGLAEAEKGMEYIWR